MPLTQNACDTLVEACVDLWFEGLTEALLAAAALAPRASNLMIGGARCATQLAENFLNNVKPLAQERSAKRDAAMRAV